MCQTSPEFGLPGNAFCHVDSAPYWPVGGLMQHDRTSLGICVFVFMCTARSSCHASPYSTNLACIAGFEAEKILVKCVCRLKTGNYFLASRVWQSSAGICYDDRPLTPRGAEGLARPWLPENACPSTFLRRAVVDRGWTYIASLLSTTRAATQVRRRC